jgi:uncharacterized protein (TIGR03086 family)
MDALLPYPGQPGTTTRPGWESFIQSGTVTSSAADESRALADSGAALRRRLLSLAPARYGLPSICPGWSAADLANHVVGGELRYWLLLRGAEPGVMEGTRSQDHIGTDPADAYANLSRQLEEEFSRPGALQRAVSHRAGKRSGLELLRMRVMERALHGWDLARTLGLDDSLDGSLAEYLLATCLPLVSDLRARGLYGSPADAGPAEPPARRLLRLTGRDPGAVPPGNPGHPRGTNAER